VVGLCEESVTLRCLEDLLTESEDRFLSSVSILSSLAHKR
jgi:hypothetical protein